MRGSSLLLWLCVGIACSSAKDNETTVRYNPRDASIDASRLDVDASGARDAGPDSGGRPSSDAGRDSDLRNVTCPSYPAPPQGCEGSSACEQFSAASAEIPATCNAAHQRCMVAGVGDANNQFTHGQVIYDSTKTDFGDHAFVINWPAGGNALFYRYFTRPHADALLGSAPHAVIAFTGSDGLNDDAAWFYVDYATASMSAAAVGGGVINSVDKVTSGQCGKLPVKPNGWVCFSGGATFNPQAQTIDIEFSTNFGIRHVQTVAAPVANLTKVGYAELRVPDPPTAKFAADVDTFEVSSAPLPCPANP